MPPKRPAEDVAASSSKRARAAAEDDEFMNESIQNSEDELAQEREIMPTSLLPRGATINISALTRKLTQAKRTSTSAAATGDPDADLHAYRRQQDALVSYIFHEQDFSFLNLKPDHASRPLWINPGDGHIILEGFSPIAEQAQDFLIAISEPVSRPAFMHEYKLTSYSLYAAVSVGLETNDIIDVLGRLSKVPVPESIIQFIRDCTISYGKVKLVLKHNKYFVESTYADTLQRLLKDSIIRSARVQAESTGAVGGLTASKAPVKGSIVIPGTAKEPEKKDQPAKGSDATKPGDASSTMDKAKQSEAELFASILGVDNDDIEEDDETVHSFQIDDTKIDDVKKRCNELDYPMLEEYDFRNDTVNPNLDIDLKPQTTIRPYQEKSLSKMFGNGRARSGIIVLPCGAGKTLVGITAACTIKKSCLVLCTSAVSCRQWRTQFLQWSNVQEKQITEFTSDNKEKFTSASGIIVSTYSMIATTQNRSHETKKMMDFITSREWGFILLDEVHVVPAAMFRRVVTTVKAHAKLGLTATLVREDDKITDLNYMIGPKLYEANWMELAAKGHIANVQCAEVWCPMTPEFYREYLKERRRKRDSLSVMNPGKFQACQFLIKFHEGRGDKIIVMSDDVFALSNYARKLSKPFLHGGTSTTERMRILQHFQSDPTINTIFLSKVGDTSIDLPEATCLIQISAHFGSRRQEAQRLGRILRAKRRNDEGFNAFFYSLVSKDTSEMYYSTKRQQFLIDQGYSFKIITELDGLKNLPELVYRSRDEQIELLQTVLQHNESAADRTADMGTDFDTGTVASKGTPAAGYRAAKRATGSLSALSGGQHMSYVEQNRSVNKQLARDSAQSRHKLFKKRDKQQQQAKKDRSASAKQD